MRTFARVEGGEVEIAVSEEAGRLVLLVGEKAVEIALDDQKGPIRSAFIGGRLVEFGWTRDDGTYRILLDGVVHEVVLRDPRAESIARSAAAAAPAAHAEVRAPIPGLIKRVLLREGDPVKRDQAVLHLNAMKLENEIASPRDGTIRSIEVREGQAVEKGQALFVVA
ncbi:MAG: biotin/lipoyl-binding protein [Planctomycetes bacterium]|nr:biotin/lipoyl-binding protein [Planctomycetota bacterium]